MNIYLLKRDIENGHYDEAHGFVVRARGPVSARKLAGEQAGDEGKFLWLQANEAECTLLASDVKGKEGVILRDFNAG